MNPKLSPHYPGEHLREIAAYIRHLEARIEALEERCCGDFVEPQPESPTDIPTDAAFIAEVAAVAAELRPDAMTVHHAGFGRYEIRDADGRRIAPVYGWFNKADANEYVENHRDTV